MARKSWQRGEGEKKKGGHLVALARPNRDGEGTDRGDAPACAASFCVCRRRKPPVVKLYGFGAALVRLPIGEVVRCRREP